jgi:citronellol/citronellal dehydrogenase
MGGPARANHPPVRSSSRIDEGADAMLRFADKTVFISGGSRGIGKAIALRLAQAGANIVITGKSETPHPKLPGTIYSAAADIEAAGGQALAVPCDIRFEEQVEAAVAAAVNRFGGIDILLNNASAVNLTQTLDTPLKRFDLMMNVNLRGTFLCSQACLPHLLKAENPHILTLSPPLDLRGHPWNCRFRSRFLHRRSAQTGRAAGLHS